jgi:hypothetical protein
MNRIWKYLFRGTTLAGAATLCVCFWLPLAHGCKHDMVPAEEVRRDFSELFELYFPFLVAALTIILLLLRWILRYRVAQAIVIVLACLISVVSLAYFGAMWIYHALPFWIENGMKYDAEFFYEATMSTIYFFAGVALYALYKCPRRIHFELSIFWCAFFPLFFFCNLGISEFFRNTGVLMYGLYVAWAASAAMCAGAAAELIRQWKTPQPVGDIPDPPALLTTNTDDAETSQIESGKSE